MLCVCVRARVQAEKWLNENDPKRVEVITIEKTAAAKRLQVKHTCACAFVPDLGQSNGKVLFAFPDSAM